MSKDGWDERRQALEDQYFDKLNQDAMARLRAREGSGEKPRLSPISGKPMQQVTVMGVVVDRCSESGGIWLDAGELEEIIKQSENEKSGGFSAFLKKLRI